MEKKKKVTNNTKKKPAKRSSSTSKTATPKRSTTRATRSTKKTTKVDKIVSSEKNVILEDKVVRKSKVNFSKYFTRRNIIIMSIVLIIVILFCVFFSRDSNRSMSYYLNNKNLNKISKLKFTNKSNSIIASKYSIDTNKIFFSGENIMLKDIEGNMLYIRESNFKANIFQSYLDIQKKIEGIPTLIVMSQYMDSFERDCLRELKIPDNIEMNENYYGMKKFKFKLTPEESILKEGREYSKSFKYNDAKYEFNYYLNGDFLACEFVRFF